MSQQLICRACQRPIIFLRERKPPFTWGSTIVSKGFATFAVHDEGQQGQVYLQKTQALIYRRELEKKCREANNGSSR